MGSFEHKGKITSKIDDQNAQGRTPQRQGTPDTDKLFKSPDSEPFIKEDEVDLISDDELVRVRNDKGM